MREKATWLPAAERPVGFNLAGLIQSEGEHSASSACAHTGDLTHLSAVVCAASAERLTVRKLARLLRSRGARRSYVVQRSSAAPNHLAR
jgi:hypothetical protein